MTAIVRRNRRDAPITTVAMTNEIPPDLFPGKIKKCYIEVTMKYRKRRSLRGNLLCVRGVSISEKIHHEFSVFRR